MNDIKKEFIYRRQVALKGDVNDVTPRLIGLLEWMHTIPQIAEIIKKLEKHTISDAELYNMAIECLGPPRPKTLEAIAGFGLAAIRYTRLHNGSLWGLAGSVAIYGKTDDDTQNFQALMERYVIPFLDYIEHRLPLPEEGKSKKNSPHISPAVIHDSLKRFRSAHRNVNATCFIMMRFGKTSAHSRMEKTIKKRLSKHGLVGLLARDREFHDDLFPNILTYIHGCAFGIAVFERVETDEFNPNVALEVGYMLGLGKQVLLLKDQTLRALHTDLVGKLYREFDPQDPESTIPTMIDGWLSDKGLA